YSQVWLVVRRTVGGSEKRCIEHIDRFPADTADAADGYFLDCGLSLDDPRTVTGATKADPVVLSVPAHGFSDGDLVDVADVTGMSELNGNRYTVASSTAETFALFGVDGTEFGAYASGGQVRKAVSAVAGLEHLDGETVSVVADGLVHADATVSSGSLSLEAPASRVHAGYGYPTEIETLRFEGRSPNGTVQARTKRIDHVTLRLHRSRGGRAGPDPGTLDDIELASGASITGAALFSGDRAMAFPAGFGIDGRVVVRQDEPLPFTLLGVIVNIDVAAR
ncbi:MAG: hypothetical protein JJ899_03065, partial [Alphaproteobacteria bacterium]|nr:hypothetical protein [Alphaproteobacteria bacterium]